ncbi:methylated-DNA--protein-cysteine methyltransferase [Lingula anatina]|uniref:Methylated-DNA--protein-cysteine methyltransferase n=1 Tax=Lingula anatina TaxID=7574 RepID=A0A1S3JXX5_LINAN|nr:methylated-DNA--protein-cysteine methyltransferase [Lingula anatina]|eukprot:XP_013414906.1 methylated-DNA--protein-cysteine methyltransferase [Lingula anatina]
MIKRSCSKALKKRPIMPLGAIKSKSKCQYGPTNTYILSSPIGNFEVICCQNGIHSMGQIKEITDETFRVEKGKEVKIVSQLYKDNGYIYTPLIKLCQWLQIYFTGGSEVKSLPLPSICFASFKEGTFTGKVWKTLAEKVGFGETVSYGKLANLCGSPHGSRAAGQAMRNNPIQIIVPCHRVILSSGQIGNYTGGRRNKVKAWLLEHEGSFPPEVK